MLTIECALDLYTNDILTGKKSSLSAYTKQLPQEDVKEFLESAKIISILYSYKKAPTFDKLFETINDHKEQLYNTLSNAVDFRGNGDKEAADQIDALFSKEFDE